MVDEKETFHFGLVQAVDPIVRNTNIFDSSPHNRVLQAAKQNYKQKIFNTYRRVYGENFHKKKVLRNFNLVERISQKQSLEGVLKVEKLNKTQLREHSNFLNKFNSFYHTNKKFFVTAQKGESSSFLAFQRATSAVRQSHTQRFLKTSKMKFKFQNIVNPKPKEKKFALMGAKTALAFKRKDKAV